MAMIEHLEHRVGGPFRGVPAQQVMKLVDPRNLPLLGLRVAQQREQRGGKLRGSTSFITCCAGTRRKGPPTRCSRCSIMAMPKLVVCGVDEAGRGPLAGPVYAAAVILNPARRINGLADSKLLAPERREVLAGRIKERAIP